MRPANVMPVLLLSLTLCGPASAGPIDNAQQFQNKAFNNAVKNNPTKTARSGKSLIKIDNGMAVRPAADKGTSVPKKSDMKRPEKAK
jgi:hypothetical protein